MPQRELAREELDELIDACREAIMVRDPDGRIVWWNRGAEEMYGWTKDEALGKTSHILLHTEFPIPMTEIVKIVGEGRQWEGELNHICKDGQRITVLSRWSGKRTRSPQPEILEMNTDISIRKQYERRVEQVNKVMVDNEKEILRLRMKLADAGIDGEK